MKYAQAPKPVTREQMRQRGLMHVWQAPNPSAITAADLVKLGLRQDDAEQVVADAARTLG